MVVFDFDKTLTYQDSLLGFYKELCKTNLDYLLKLTCYAPLLILTKLKWLSNTSLKKIGVILFLKGKEKSEIETKALEYSKKIKLNKIHSNYFNNRDIDESDNIMILSASFEVYLRPIFENSVRVFGSTLNYDQNNRVHSLRDNLHGVFKKEFLQNKIGTQGVDKFYTDSYSDRFVAEISNTIIVVKGDKEIVCPNYDSFLKYKW